MRFVDEAKITVRSGKGGPGAVSFRREAMIPRGGPDGGDGGKGGSVIFKVDHGINSLLEFKYTKNYFAQDGQPGKGANMSGADGEDLVILVPAGTLIKDLDGNLIHDMGDQGEFLLLEGGKGGKGNTFYKSSVNQAPMKAQKGLPGEERNLHLELKLIADVGLLGRPNAGKSTFISKVSAARPKIADYPFTTLTPNLGVVRYHDFKSFVIADIPGLIKGANEGVGLGVQFLRHIERTRVFLHIIDISEMNELEPWEAYAEIMEELRLRDETLKDQADYWPLLQRPQVVVLNKCDIVPDEKVVQIRKKFLDNGVQTQLISAATGLGLEKIIDMLASYVFKADSKSENTSEKTNE